MEAPKASPMSDNTNPMEAAARMFAQGIADHLVPILRDQLAAITTPAPAAAPAKFITTREAAELLGRSEYWIRERKEALGGRKPPGSKYLYFDRERIDQYIREAGHITPAA
jgi:hypothetical protein